MIHMNDWLPTFINYVSGNQSSLPNDLDGIDQSSYLFNKYRGKKSNRNEFLYHIMGNITAFRWYQCKCLKCKA